MKMRMLLALLVTLSPVLAKEVYPELTSVDGSRTMRAKPVAVEGEKIRFERQGKETFTAKPEVFSTADQENLRAWMAAVAADPHQALVDRVKKAEKLRVLFVGNSYSFKIPKVFEKLARSEGREIEVGQVTKGGWTLAKHAAAKETLDRISGGKWDVVVLQEQSLVPAFPDGQRREMMDPPAKTLASAVRDSGAIPVFFLTWGRRDGDRMNAGTFPDDTYMAMQKRLIAGYTSAAKHAGGVCLVPVGRVWSTLREAGEDGGLYAPDGSHPASRGNYLGACVFYCALYDESVTTKAGDIEDSAVVRDAASARLAVPTYPLAP